LNIVSISASTAIHSRPAAALMRLSRLSGRNREYLASNAPTQATTARSNAAACGSPPDAAYCTSQVVPSAGNDSLRNGTFALVPVGAGGGGRCDWAMKAMRAEEREDGEERKRGRRGRLGERGREEDGGKTAES